jgi:hypothetical protein
VTGEHIRYPFFTCPTCHCELCVPNTFRIKAHLLGAGAAVFLCYSGGLKGIALILSAIVASLALGVVLTVIGTVVIPPSLEKYWRPGHLQL